MRVAPVDAAEPAVDSLDDVDGLEAVVPVALPAELSGLRAVVVVADPADGEPGAAETRRPAPDTAEVRRLAASSSDCDGCERCEAVVEAVPGRLATVGAPAAGRAGGLVRVLPAVEVREVVPVVLVAVPDIVPGRLTPDVAVPAVFFAAAAEGDGIFLASPAALGGDFGVGVGAVASSRWTTSKPSASDIVRVIALDAVGA